MSAAENPGLRSFVLLQVGSRRFALPAGSVTELAPPVRLHTFPHNSPLVAGVIVRRGRIVPVYDAAPILMGRESPIHRFYLIAERDFGGASEPSAIPVNGECELVASDVWPSASDDPAYVCGKLEVESEQIPVLNLELLLAMPPVPESGAVLPSAGAQVPL
ncbi:MAG: chemotaxis protein CheW [Candidatus Acidiferrales bacterium]